MGSHQKRKKRADNDCDEGEGEVLQTYGAVVGKTSESRIGIRE
jgi:hypothetical protein